MKILTFGELMLRLKTPEHLKILQADTFEASYGGAEELIRLEVVDYITDSTVCNVMKKTKLNRGL